MLYYGCHTSTVGLVSATGKGVKRNVDPSHFSIEKQCVFRKVGTSGFWATAQRAPREIYPTCTFLKTRYPGESRGWVTCVASTTFFFLPRIPCQPQTLAKKKYFSSHFCEENFWKLQGVTNFLPPSIPQSLPIKTITHLCG